MQKVPVETELYTFKYACKYLFRHFRVLYFLSPLISKVPPAFSNTAQRLKPKASLDKLKGPKENGRSAYCSIKYKNASLSQQTQFLRAKMRKDHHIKITSKHILHIICLTRCNITFNPTHKNFYKKTHPLYNTPTIDFMLILG